MNHSIILLSPASNYAIVHMQERKFPGIVFQGDSLDSKIKQLENSINLLREGNAVEALEELEGMKGDLMEILQYYERICEGKGFNLPYKK